MRARSSNSGCPPAEPPHLISYTATNGPGVDSNDRRHPPTMHLPPRPGRQNHRKTTDDPHTPGDGKDPAFITHGSSAKRCMTPLTNR